jgi:hypothetical protein
VGSGRLDYDGPPGVFKAALCAGGDPPFCSISSGRWPIVTTEEPLRRGNHWVPASYLAAFAAEETRKGVLYVYDREHPERLPFTSSAERVARENKLYVVKGPSGQEHDLIERYFADHIEKPFGPVRNRLVFGPEIGLSRTLSRAEWEVLCLFVSCLWLRTPVMRESLNHIITFLATHDARQALQERQAKLARGESIPEAVQPELVRSSLQALDEGRIVGRPSHAAWLQIALPMMVQGAREIQRIPHRVVDYPPGLELPATDAPVVMSQQLPDGHLVATTGWVNSTTLITVPLSPRVLLVMGYGINGNRTIGSRSWCEAARARVISAADRWVYAGEPAKDIGQLLSQSVRQVARVEYSGGMAFPGDSVNDAVRRMMETDPEGASIRLGFGQPPTFRDATKGLWEWMPGQLESLLLRALDRSQRKPK